MTPTSIADKGPSLVPWQGDGAGGQNAEHPARAPSLTAVAIEGVSLIRVPGLPPVRRE